MHPSAQKSHGFTLIELLVVIAIIGLLSSVVLSSLNGARKKGRDARRMADLKQIQVAQELYYGQQTVPAYSATIAGLVTAGVIPSEPKDPGTNASYSIAVNGTSFYCVGATLETTPLPISSCNTGATGLNAAAPAGNYVVGP
ncbi:prepilin-type N-terminal cleavage/methylation domain-containing protein [Candidatus Kaiserbacteria bacterium]|nr:prepilin-type N-terminal cleavage/methylation domain-containing protein [Candidatus Kaiserbacteria bacterium]